MARVIIPRGEFQDEFDRLCEQYNHYYWAVAWAGMGFRAVNTLHRNRSKIDQIVFGLTFSHTSPAFIKKFQDEDAIHYTMAGSGTFHPKVFLFEDDEGNWELLVGSVNFTYAAFTRNTEAAVLLSSATDSVENMTQVKEWIAHEWEVAKPLKPWQIKKYEASAKKKRSISGVLMHVWSIVTLRRFRSRLHK